MSRLNRVTSFPRVYLPLAFRGDNATENNRTCPDRSSMIVTVIQYETALDGPDETSIVSLPSHYYFFYIA